MHSQITHKIYQPEKKICMSCKWKQLVTKQACITTKKNWEIGNISANSYHDNIKKGFNNNNNNNNNTNNNNISHSILFAKFFNH